MTVVVIAKYLSARSMFRLRTVFGRFVQLDKLPDHLEDDTLYLLCDTEHLVENVLSGEILRSTEWKDGCTYIYRGSPAGYYHWNLKSTTSKPVAIYNRGTCAHALTSLVSSVSSKDKIYRLFLERGDPQSCLFFIVYYNESLFRDVVDSLEGAKSEVVVLYNKDRAPTDAHLKLCLRGGYRVVEREGAKLGPSFLRSLLPRLSTTICTTYIVSTSTPLSIGAPLYDTILSSEYIELCRSTLPVIIRVDPDGTLRMSRSLCRGSPDAIDFQKLNPVKVAA
jgi:hypothetical protein